MKKKYDWTGIVIIPWMKNVWRIMKLTSLFLLISVVSVFANKTYSQTKTLNLNIEKATVKEVLTKIEEQSEFYFMYSGKFIDVNREVSVHAENQKIETVLDLLFAGTNVGYTVKDRFIVLTTPELIRDGTLAVLQQQSVSGKVTDSSGAPLPGVTVVVKGTTQGTVTNADGEYSLINIPADATLQFSFVGMKTLEIAVGNQASINVTLEEEAIGIEEVVAIGYGTQKKVSLTGGISQVGDEKIKSSPVANITQALQGAAPGVDVNFNNTPGAGAKIRIHGRGTINNNDPLWIVDGVPGVSTDQINPNDIESISILKDAASTAIYGSRGANGVILVTTKQGKEGQPIQAHFSTRLGIANNSAKYDLLSVEEYGEMLWLQAENSGVAPTHPIYGNGAEPSIPKYLLPAGADEVDLSLYDVWTYPITEANQEGTDWHDVFFNQGAKTQEYNLSLSGSTKNTTYSFGLGHLNEEGIIKLTGFKRYSLNTSIISKLRNWLEIGGSVKLGYTNDLGYQTTGESSPIQIVQQIPAIVPVYDVMGNYSPVSRLTGFDAITNAWGDIERAKDFTYKTLGINGNVYAKISLMKNLSFKTMFGYILNHSVQRQPLNANPDSKSARTDNQLTMDLYKGFQWNSTNTIDYSNTFIDSHNINVLLGTEAISQESESFGATRTGYLLTTDNYYILNAGSGEQTNWGSSSEWATFSIFGRMHYDFKNKYLLDAVVRRDGSSRFGKENRYGIFPSVGIGWRISEENFMAGVSNWLNSLKLRGSWGQSGNDQIGNYNGFTTMGTSMTYSYYPLTGSNSEALSGFQSTAYGNESAKWEKTISSTIGLDGIFFNSFEVTLDLWERQTKDMLYRVGVPAVVGNATVPSVNIGEMKNSGFDFQLNYRKPVNKDLSYDISLNVSHYRNEIVKLTDNANEAIWGGSWRSSQYHKSEVGTSFPEIFGYKVLGIFQSDEEAANYPAAFGGSYNAAGHFKYKDVNEDGIIDSDDRTYIGNPHPDFMSGLTTSIRYKQFEFSAMFYASVGNDIINHARRNMDFNFFQWNRSKRRLYESWGSPYLKNNEDAKMPIAEISDTYSQLPSSYFVEDGSYLRLENLQLAYNLPNRVVKYLGLKSLRVNIMASNIFTITGYTGLDPQLTISDGNLGIDDGGNWPKPRRFMLGVDIDL